jgi:hypothetical protein
VEWTGLAYLQAVEFEKYSPWHDFGNSKADNNVIALMERARE